MYFVQVFMHALWWLQSAKITTGSSILLARARTFFSMLDPAPMTILLVHARSFTHKQNKCIYFRQHHMFMNIRRIRKKRKYLTIKLTCACSSDWSNMCTWWGCGCHISRDVLIKSLNKFDQLSMSTIKFCLTSYVFQRFMVRMYNKFFGP